MKIGFRRIWRVMKCIESLGIGCTALMFLLVACTATDTQIWQQPTITPAEVASLFEDDSCAPPCWFGIIPGESTSEDVQEKLGPWVDSGVLGADFSGLSANVRFPVFWPLSDWNLNRAYTDNIIAIEDNLVIYIDVLMNREVTLGDVIETYGLPSFAIAFADLNTGLLLVYLDLSINVAVFTVGPDTACDLQTIEDNMQLYSVEYYELDKLSMLLKYDIGTSKFLDSSTLDKWLSNNETVSCVNAIEQLTEYYQGVPNNHQ